MGLQSKQRGVLQKRIVTTLLVSALFVTGMRPVLSSAVEESTLPQRFTREILPYFDTGMAGSFTGRGGLRIAYRIFPPATGAPLLGAKAIVLLNGRSEFMRKYAEFIFDLRNEGYAIYTMDHRGQGESGRMLPESQKGYVSRFDDYVDDLDTFMNQVVRPQGPSEIHVVAHSMGGTIATMYAIEHPGAFGSMVFSSPMYQANLGNYTEWEALLMADLMKIFGLDLDVAPGRTLDEWKAPFETNHVTSSRNRYDYARWMLEQDPAFAVGGPTGHWVHEAILGGRWVRENARSLLTPVMILEAGNEQVVMPKAEEQVCSEAAHCEIHVMDGSKHEIFMERDSIRDRALSLMLNFLRKS